jgi:glucose/arabinose dehydrogenase
MAAVNAITTNKYEYRSSGTTIQTKSSFSSTVQSLRNPSRTITCIFSLLLLLAMVPPIGSAIIAPVNAQQASQINNGSNTNNIVLSPVTRNSPSVNDPNLKVEQFATGLKSPTTMAFLDEHRILVLEKDMGTVRMIIDGKLQPKPLLHVAVANNGEEGMLGIATSVENTTTNYVFLYYTQPGQCNCLYRYELQNNDQLVNPKLLLALPATPGPVHNGGIIAIGPTDGYVYVVIGDLDGHKTKAQNYQNGADPDGTSGILRIGKNGETPSVIVGGSGPLIKYYYAYGIRNSFGLAFDPLTGKLWDTENGPNYGDEINLVDAGFNSGWAKVSGMVSQDQQNILSAREGGGLVFFNNNTKSHYHNPEFSWNQTVAPTAIDFLNSDKLGKQYQNDMFVGDYNGGDIYHFKLNQTRTGLVLPSPLAADHIAHSYADDKYITFGTGFGGITDIKTGPDGYLYVVSYFNGAIYRIVPAAVPDNQHTTATIH